MKISFLAPTLNARAGGIISVVESLGAALRVLPRTSVDCFAPRSLSISDLALGRSRRALVESVTNAASDIVHTHGLWLVHSQAGADLRRRGALPEVVSPHGMLDPWAMRHQRWKKRLMWLWTERSHLANASVVHALCAPEHEAVRRLGLSVPVARIPNGVRLPKPAAPMPAPWADVFPAGSKVLLYLGRMHPKKGVLPLIDAWAKSKARRGEWKLALFGWQENGHGEQCRHAIERHGIADTCRWFGPAFGDLKTAAYANSNAFVLPSFSEGLPMTILEAWAHRLPVFMTAACNLPEGFAAGAAQEIATEPERLAEQLDQGLIANGADARRAAMGEAGRALVERNFTWERIAGQFVELYQWAINGGSRPSFVET